MASAKQFHGPMPNPRIRSLQDGSVRITIGNISQVVYSPNLIETRLRLLQLLWRANPGNWL